MTLLESDISRIVSISNVSKVITHSSNISNQIVETVFIVNDGISSQFGSRYFLHVLKNIHYQFGVAL